MLTVLNIENDICKNLPKDETTDQFATANNRKVPFCLQLCFWISQCFYSANRAALTLMRARVQGAVPQCWLTG